MIFARSSKGFARAIIGAVMAYVIFFQALGGAIAGSHHPGRSTAGLDALFVLCTSDGMQTTGAGSRQPEKPNSPVDNCCGWGCGSIPAALDQLSRGMFVFAWRQALIRAVAFTVDDTKTPPQRIGIRSNPVRGPPLLQV
jgi:hypothetical protein